MKFQIVRISDNKVLDEDALPTMHMLADWPGRKGTAVLRGRCWYAVDYPGFEVGPTETPVRIRIKEVQE